MTGETISMLLFMTVTGEYLIIKGNWEKISSWIIGTVEKEEKCKNTYTKCKICKKCEYKEDCKKGF